MLHAEQVLRVRVHFFWVVCGVEADFERGPELGLEEVDPGSRLARLGAVARPLAGLELGLCLGALGYDWITWLVLGAVDLLLATWAVSSSLLARLVVPWAKALNQVQLEA